MLHSIPSTALPSTASGTALTSERPASRPTTPLDELAANPATQRRLSEKAATAAAAIRAGTTGDVTSLFDELPDHWLIGQAASLRSAAASTLAATSLPLPSLFETTSDRQQYTHFMPYGDARVLARQKGPRMASGGRWQLAVPETEPLLFHSARFGDPNVLSQLLRRFGADPHANVYTQCDAGGYTLLHLASWSGNAAAVEAVIKAYEQATARTHAAPVTAFVNDLGPDGETPLHVGVLQGNRGLVATLMLRGADATRSLRIPNHAYNKFLTQTACNRLVRGKSLSMDYDSVSKFVIERAPNLHDLLSIACEPSTSSVPRDASSASALSSPSSAPSANVPPLPNVPVPSLRFRR